MTEPGEVNPARAAAIMMGAAAETAAQAQQHTPDPTQEDFRAHGREIVRTLGALSTLSSVLAAQIRSYRHHHLLADVADADSAQQLAAAGDHLRELHTDLNMAQTAAEAYRAALAHLIVDGDPNATPGSE